MKSILFLIGEQLLKYYGKWDIFVFTGFTLLAILFGQVTVFYLIYFFWWTELITISIDRFFILRNPNALFKGENIRWGIWGSYFMMAIYWVFIIIIFLALAPTHDDDIMINAGVLTFRNIFFNLNLLYILIQRVRLHLSHQPIDVYYGGFTPNAIVLHGSVVVGAVLVFFVIREYPEFFNTGNRFGSVLLALPFLLIKIGSYYGRDYIENLKRSSDT